MELIAIELLLERIDDLLYGRDTEETDYTRGGSGTARDGDEKIFTLYPWLKHLRRLH